MFRKLIKPLFQVLWKQEGTHSQPVFNNPNWVEWLREQKLSPNSEDPFPALHNHHQGRDPRQQAQIFNLQAPESPLTSTGEHPDPHRASVSGRENSPVDPSVDP